MESVYISNEGVLLSFFLPAVIALISLVVLFSVRSIAFRVIRSWAYNAKTDADEIIIRSIRTPSVYWITAISLYTGIVLSGLPDDYSLYLTNAIYIIVVLSVSFATANLSDKLLRNYANKSNLPLPATGLAYGLIKGAIITIGVLTALGVLGVSIIPLLTALGIGGLAIALALKDTLTNLFAGLHIIAENSVRVGDFIMLETGQEGYVEDITWRSTRIRVVQNNMVVIPNNMLSQSVITNYSLPDKVLVINILFSVSYDADPERIENLIVDTARLAAGELSGLLDEPPPVVWFSPGFGESSLDFVLKCHIREIAERGVITHSLRKRILLKLREEGISIPFPQRVVYIKNRQGL